jgi:sulfonate transport system substrate-binding protein
MTSTNGVVQGNLGWAEQKGLLLKELKPVGVEKIEFSFFQAGTDVQAALLSDAIDVAVTGDMPALQTKGNGADTRLIGFTSVNGDTWLIGRKGGPRTIRGLVGKTVTAPHGTIRYRVLYGLLHDAGLLKQVPIANVPTPESLAGLKSGKVDAMTVGGTTAALLEKQGFVVIDKASNHPKLLSTEPTTAKQDFLSAHPGFAAAWGRGIQRVNQDIRAHADEYWAYSAKKDDVDVALARIAEPVEHFNVDPLPEAGLAQLRSTYDFLNGQKLIEKPFDLDAWVAGE